MEPGEGDHSLQRKRLRKPRGRGLRTNTGCLTCRKRHKKCDERRPVCGPCTARCRDCIYPSNLDTVSTTAVPEAQSQSQSADSDWLHGENDDPGTSASSAPAASRPIPVAPLHANVNVPPQDTWSPDSAFWTTDFASTRWLDLLANDAAQADSGFSLAPTPAPREGDERLTQAADIQSLHTRLSVVAAAERKSWQANADATLTSHEAGLLRHFAERCALWLDLFDPQRLFSTHAIRLALRNAGLMKAILALAARHRAKLPQITQAGEQDSQGLSALADNEWIRYYYETLHYVQEALAYNSYTNSKELLATAIVISSYEMLDESDGQGNWQRHLKGVFWIQRSQDVNGASGGLRQAVWWAWLRQDIWAAFREKRPCLSFWVPVQKCHELDQNGLADRAMYLLSQAVNYYAHSRAVAMDPMADPSASLNLHQVKEELLRSIEQWKSCLGDQYKPLPIPSSPSDVFTRLWVHPPQFGVALQAISFAQILIALHSPTPVGFNGYLRLQKTLSDAVDTICGIAMELEDEGCQIMSAQCLYGAGLCVQDGPKQDKIVLLMEACESRVGWAPMATWRDDLRHEWAKADGERGQDGFT
ncbi:hypothetical protein CEP52_016563 [Fusarium oligoseptatum]|uniref:Zn(2)-C6 fungal-type domain-containing protein n=1 Tax=Fusarium oligoseptatum TaxID=2604345 RepID=A0A428S299_9HYPO|nr:hypothetical protein CEP52_016563 [Fusarium oligoseptatum]